MAKAKLTPSVEHIHGQVGSFVYKSRYGVNIIAQKPDHVTQPNTPAQQAAKGSFTDAADYAKGAMANPQLHAAYMAEAKIQKSSPNAVAIKDWMTAPTVKLVDLSHYSKQVGDVIYVKAIDDFQVTGVHVSIEDSAHAAIESGAAVFDMPSNAWKYTVTVDATAKGTVTVTASAMDNPGNVGTLSATK